MDELALLCPALLGTMLFKYLLLAHRIADPEKVEPLWNGSSRIAHCFACFYGTFT